MSRSQYRKQQIHGGVFELVRRKQKRARKRESAEVLKRILNMRSCFSFLFYFYYQAIYSLEVRGILSQLLGSLVVV